MLATITLRQLTNWLTECNFLTLKSVTLITANTAQAVCFQSFVLKIEGWTNLIA